AEAALVAEVFVGVAVLASPGVELLAVLRVEVLAIRRVTSAGMAVRGDDGVVAPGPIDGLETCCHVVLRYHQNNPNLRSCIYFLPICQTSIRTSIPGSFRTTIDVVNGGLQRPDDLGFARSLTCPGTGPSVSLHRRLVAEQGGIMVATTGVPGSWDPLFDA